MIKRYNEHDYSNPLKLKLLSDISSFREPFTLA